MTIAQTLLRIRAFAAQPGWTKTRLAREAGLHDTRLRHMDDDGWNPTRRTIEALESVIPPDWQPGPGADTPTPSEAA
ncbi:helix-turn-helix domain-containing protein [Phaeospirillum tilakii]|uniref:Helix-turn-helix domain-containing protein n=1 Tax=Phaeospirillum tilakii TaxID=741673 RepID=A0ABW5C602_9PROT